MRRWQYPELTEPFFPEPEPPFPDEWHRDPQIPVLRIFPIAVYAVSLFFVDIETSAKPLPLDQWEPRVSQPLFDVQRQQYTYPQEAVCILDTNNREEFPAADKWEPRAPPPLFDRARLQYTYPSFFFGDDEAVMEVDFISWMEHDRPLPAPFYRPDHRHTYPTEAFLVLDESQRPARNTVDMWEPVSFPPLFDRPRWQHLYPTWTFGIEEWQPEAGPTVFVDYWEPRIIKPLFDHKRQQYSYPFLDQGPLLDESQRPEDPTLNKWEPKLFVPPDDVSRTQYLYPSWAFGMEDWIPEPEMFGDQWEPRLIVPLFDKDRRQWAYPSFFYQEFDANIVRPPLDRWDPRVYQPLFDVPRQQWSYPFFFSLGDPIPGQPIRITTAEITLQFAVNKSRTLKFMKNKTETLEF